MGKDFTVCMSKASGSRLHDVAAIFEVKKNLIHVLLCFGLLHVTHKKRH